MASLSAIILAAGKGTRMKSDLPKVAHEVAGRAMVLWVVDACVKAGAKRIVLVVGYRQEVVRRLFAGYESPGVSVEFVEQVEQLGTGHAVLCAREKFGEEIRSFGDGERGNDLLVLAGDGPLVRAGTLSAILGRHRGAGAAATLATSVIADPGGYGRVIRDGAGAFVGIVEQRNATPEQLGVREVNPSYYCFEAGALFEALEKVERNPASGEYYITDVPGLLVEAGERVEVIEAVAPEDVLSINTLEQLAEVGAILGGRLSDHGGRCRAGVGECGCAGAKGAVR